MNHHGSKVSILDSDLAFESQDETLKVLHPSNKRLDIIGGRGRTGDVQSAVGETLKPFLQPFSVQSGS